MWTFADIPVGIFHNTGWPAEFPRKPGSTAELGERTVHGADVGTAEQPDVDQKRIKVVKVQPFLEKADPGARAAW